MTEVLITGGTGTTGSQVAAFLNERDVPNRQATRNPISCAHVRFDWADRATHRDALRTASSARPWPEWTVLTVSADELAERITVRGIPADIASMLAALDVAIRGGAEDRVTNAVERVTGRPPRGFRTFAAERIR